MTGFHNSVLVFFALGIIGLYAKADVSLLAGKPT